jgi:hypothetical protein
LRHCEQARWKWRHFRVTDDADQFDVSPPLAQAVDTLSLSTIRRLKRSTGPFHSLREPLLNP